MIQRIKSLGRYQQGILVFLTALVLVFTVIYPVTIARVGFAYQNAILVPNQEDGYVTYSGKIQGEQAVFTVYADQKVVFQYGDQTYEPYLVREDATAVPENSEMAGAMTGIEVYQGEELLFRGGVVMFGEECWLYDEDGSNASISIFSTDSDGTVRDENGVVIDPMEPSVETILALINEPELTHKGQWIIWFCGIFVCAATVVSILFADELFRWQLAFQIRNVEDAEPSDWELACRYLSWTALSIFATIIFFVGLR